MISYYADPDLTRRLLDFLHRREAGDHVRMLLAEGDSWFSIGGGTSNLLMALDDDDTLIVSCASPGNTMRHIGQLGNTPFWNLLSPRFGVQWDGVLLSAGGNDLLADVGALVEDGHLSPAWLDLELARIKRGYLRILRTVREHQDCPVHAHTYDYPVSDHAGGWLRAGPWIGNRLTEYGIQPERHDQIVREIIDGLARCLHSVEGLTVHDTRGTLEPGRWRWIGWQKHWRNEIHPTVAGYAALAARWKL